MHALSRETAIELFERRRQAWLSGDTDAYLDLWSDDMVIEIPGRDAPIAGQERYARLVEASMRRMQPIGWDFHSLAVDEDRVLAEWTIEGEVRDAGRRVRWRGMSICRIREGLICEWREYWDPARLEP
jgi:ketosteroid isomerase-like protein